MPGHRTRTQIPIVELLEKGADVAAIDCRWGFPQAMKESREGREVAAVTLHAIGRQAFLNPSKIQKQLDFWDEGGV